MRVSGKRQITIPLKYYQALGLDDQVECSIEDGALVIRPISQDGNEFSIEILKDLVAQGLASDALIRKFSEQSQQIKSAIHNILDEAEDIASGKKPSAGMKDIFGDNDHV